MRQRVEQIICRLASISYQRKYIVAGTKAEYVLPEELVEEATSLLKIVISNPAFSASFSIRELQCFTDMVKCFDEESSNLFSEIGRSLNKDLIENNESWSNIRETAKRCLEVLNADLNHCEQALD